MVKSKAVTTKSNITFLTRSYRLTTARLCLSHLGIFVFVYEFELVLATPGEILMHRLKFHSYLSMIKMLMTSICLILYIFKCPICRKLGLMS